MSKLDKLGAALDRDNYDWLLHENEYMATAIAEAVASGTHPNAIGRYMLRQIGEDRRAFISRCVSAARHLASEQQR